MGVSKCKWVWSQVGPTRPTSTQSAPGSDSPSCHLQGVKICIIYHVEKNTRKMKISIAKREFEYDYEVKDVLSLLVMKS